MNVDYGLSSCICLLSSHLFYYINPDFSTLPLVFCSYAFFSSRTEDSGLLTHKETLPVRSLVLGDIQRPGSEAVYRVGPLQCHGDRKTPYGFRLPIYLHLIYENSYYFVFIFSFYHQSFRLKRLFNLGQLCHKPYQVI